MRPHMTRMPLAHSNELAGHRCPALHCFNSPHHSSWERCPKNLWTQGQCSQEVRQTAHLALFHIWNTAQKSREDWLALQKHTHVFTDLERLRPRKRQCVNRTELKVGQKCCCKARRLWKTSSLCLFNKVSTSRLAIIRIIATGVPAASPSQLWFSDKWLISDAP